jgi:hypothetical protein
MNIFYKLENNLIYKDFKNNPHIHSTNSSNKLLIDSYKII